MNHDRYTDRYIGDILKSSRNIAMVGASANDNRPSYFALKYLLGKGYNVHPINPGLAGKELLGRKVYASLKEVPAPIDMVDIFRASEAAGEIVAEAVVLREKLGLKVIWMQLGVRNDEAATVAEVAGMKVVMNRCPKIEYGRLCGELAWSGIYSGSVSSVRLLLSPKGIDFAPGS